MLNYRCNKRLVYMIVQCMEVFKVTLKGYIVFRITEVFKLHYYVSSYE